jgi:predicted HTH domain antitoxin
MQNTIEIECPQEILLGLHLDADQFADLVKEEAAIALFREGRLSSGMASSWLGVPRAHFLLKAMQAGGANLLENNEDDFLREISLL